MDPLTLAAKRFLAQLENSWNFPPTSPLPPGPRIVRMVADPSDRGDLVKSLRWLEWSSESRRPLVIFEDAFEDEPRWLRALVAKTADDCEAVQKGLTEDGIPVAPLPARPPETAIDAAAALRYLDVLAEHMAGGVLDGLSVVLGPRRVTDPKAYRDTIAKVVASPIGATLRLAVLDVPDANLGALLPSEARFEVDRDELCAFLKPMGPKPSKGPGTPKPPSPAPETAEPCPPSEKAAETLRALLLDAGQALAEGKAKLAVQHFDAAQAHARAHGLMAEECAMARAAEDWAATRSGSHSRARPRWWTGPPLARALSLLAWSASFGRGGRHPQTGR